MKKFVFIIATSLATSTVATAGGFKMVPGEPLRSGAESYPVHGRNGILIRQKLTFGDYFTTQVRRGAIRRWYGQSGVPGQVWVQHMEGRQSIRFSLSNGTDTAYAETLSKVSSNDLIIGANPNSLPNVLSGILTTTTSLQKNNFSVSITLGKEQPEWELFLNNNATQLHRSEPAGYLRCDTAYYTIVPVRTIERKGKIANMPFGSVGLEFRDAQGHVHGAVSLLDGGEVFLGKELPAQERLLLSAASTALLLQSADVSE